MTKRRKFMLIVLTVLIVISLVTIISWITTPMRRPERMFRNYILRITPLGTNIYDVIDIIDNSNNLGERRFTTFERGVAITSSTNFFGRPTWGDTTGVFIVGEKSIQSYMGRYTAWWFPTIAVHVTVFWAFDEEGKLIYIHIRSDGGH